MQLTKEQSDLIKEVLSTIGGSEGYLKATDGENLKGRFIFHTCNLFHNFFMLWENTEYRYLLIELAKFYLKEKDIKDFISCEYSLFTHIRHPYIPNAQNKSMGVEVRYNFFKWLEELIVEQN